MKEITFTLAALALATTATAADFGSKGGPPPANVDEVMGVLRQDPYDMELLISFGTSKGGSAGHLALAIRDQAPGDDLVYSANFYADRSKEHEKDFYTADIMARIPKKEYLFATASTIDEKTQFGLDFGEVYKRSVIGVRVYGVPIAEREKLTAYFGRMNNDYHARAKDTEYHDGEIKYDYMHLNCAKTISSGFKYGAGYKDLQIKSTRLLPAYTTVVAALHANLPTEIAVKLLKEWDARGYRMDAVLYKKYAASTYVDPHAEEPVAFKDLPNRFPSVFSFDFRRDEGHYEDYDNLYAMYVVYNLGKYSVIVNEATRKLEIEASKAPMPYAQAAELAKKTARSDADNYANKVRFDPQGTGYPDNSHLYEFKGEVPKKPS